MIKTKRKQRKNTRTSSARIFAVLSKPVFVAKEKEILLENFAMLLGSGRGVAQSLDSIAHDIKSKALKRVVLTIAADIEQGMAISEAMQKSALFKEQSIALIKLGEESGRLNENMRVVVDQSRKQRAFRSKIRSAMMYPVFVMGLTVFVGLTVAWFVLPNLATVFSGLDIQLPLITKILIATGLFLSKHGALVISSVAATSAILFYFLFFFKKTRFVGQGILLSLPALKVVLRQAELARAGFLVGSLLKAGVPVVHAMSSLAESTTLARYKKFYNHTASHLADGETFSASFALYKKSDRLIPKPVQELIITGEQSGGMAEAFLNMGHIFEQKSETTSKNLAVLLEPLLLVIVWLGVMAVALAVILPIYSLIGNLNESSHPSTQNSEIEAVQVQESSTETPKPTPPPTTARIEILPTGLGYLNVRALPSAQADIVSRVSPRDNYEMIESIEGWYHIKIGSIDGWVSALYAKQL